jgi:hypothetical protein
VDGALYQGMGWLVTGQGGWQDIRVVGQGWVGMVGEWDGSGSGRGWWVREQVDGVVVVMVVCQYILANGK